MQIAAKELTAISEHVWRIREEKQDQFGEIGVHDDCVNYWISKGKPECRICRNYIISHSRKTNNKMLQCERGVCYFYRPKKRRTNNGND